MRFLYPARLPDPRDLSIPVHDGDTLWLTIDRGFRTKTDINCRLEGVSAPELGEAGGHDVTTFVRAWLAERNTSRWPYVVETLRVRAETHEKTTLERYLTRVTDRAGESLNDAVTAYRRLMGYGAGRV